MVGIQYPGLVQETGEQIKYEEQPLLWESKTIVPRSEWGAKEPKWKSNFKGRIEYVMCTYTGKGYCYSKNLCIKQLQHLQEINMSYDDNPDIRYSFLIGGDGLVYEGRGFFNTPKVPMRYGRIGNEALYIAFMGNFMRSPPSPLMFQARDDLIKYAVTKRYVKPKFLQFTM